MSLQNYIIDDKKISEDLLGKEEAKHNFRENQTELKIAFGKIIVYFALTALPVIMLVTVTFGLSLWYFGTLFSPITLLLGILGGALALTISCGIGEVFFDKQDKIDEVTNQTTKLPSAYEKQKEHIAQLWDRRKKLNRFLAVEAELYNNSQAREIAPLLLARIRKHNKLIQSGIRMIKLQETMDRNSATKLAPKLAEQISKKVKAEYHDLSNRLETYEVMKEMRTDMSLDITAALMDIKDLNKSDLDEFLAEQQETIALLVNNTDNDELPSA